MNNTGFYISKLVLRGQNKEDASIDFKQGLNVVSGASNTGKTFIYECINYAFGGGDTLRNIKELSGYSSVYLEIKTYRGKTLTIKRNISDKEMFYYTCELNKIGLSEPMPIKNQHDSTNPDNISTLLLNICGINYKCKLKNKQGETETFTFRDFVHLIMLGEKKIITDISPIRLSPTNYDITKSKSVFEVIMTGIDDTIFKIDKKIQENKAAVKLQIEVIDSQIINYNSEIKDLETLLNGKYTNKEDIEQNLKNINDKISNKKLNLKKLEADKEKIYKNLTELKQQKMYSEEVKNRFLLLEKNYNHDIGRLKFIDESDYYIEQLLDVRCPLCNSPWENNNKANYSNSEICTAIDAEKKKIEFQLKELNATINDLNQEIVEHNKDILVLSQKLSQVELVISNELKPIMSEYLSEMENLIYLKNTYTNIKFYKKQIEDLMKQKKSLSSTKNTIKIETPIIRGITDSIAVKFESIIKEILDNWNFEDGNLDIKYDKKTMDLIINGQAKNTFGKGYCAVLNSAYFIGIMKYLVNFANLQHPKVVILDSPLTSYKQKDGSQAYIGNPEEDVNNGVKQSFYKDLATINQGMQIIILDNSEPDKEIQDIIKYYHFTKNENLGRYGFIPIDN